MRTVLFRDLDRPECQLLGVMHQSGMGRSDDYVVTTGADDPWLAGTGLDRGARLTGLLGPEWDSLPGMPPDGCAKPGLTVLFSYDGPPIGAQAVRYVAPSGARVFSAGSMQFTWGLDDFPPRTRGGVPSPPNPAVQQFMRNVLTDMSRPAPPLGLKADPAGAGFQLTITRPSDPRIGRTEITRQTTHVCTTAGSMCSDPGLPGGHRFYRYEAASIDEWGRSAAQAFGPFWLPNAPPTVTMSGPRKVRAGARARFRVAARDRDGDTLAYRWRLDGRLLSVHANTAVLRLDRAGGHAVSVEVRDGHGGATSVSCWTRVTRA